MSTMNPVLNSTYSHGLEAEVAELPFKREFEIFSTVVDPIYTVLLVTGLLTNSINIITFLKAGVKDSVAVLLLTISISDAIFLTFFSPTLLRYTFSSLGTFQIREMNEVVNILFWPAFTFYDFSAYISVFLGVTRCACVAMPLKFKMVFTTKRTVISVIVIFIANLLLHIPVLSIHRLSWALDAAKNSTYLVLVRGSWDEYVFKQSLNDIINKNTLQVISFIILVASTIVLRYKLYESSKVRSKPASVTGSGEEKAGSNNRKTHELSPRDVRVVQSVILVCSIYILAQLPSLVYTAARNIHPDFCGRCKFSYLGCSKLLRIELGSFVDQLEKKEVEATGTMSRALVSGSEISAVRIP
ncbi:hypothetical protein EGW08_007493 [Elysia chlorotica]|uniref:G-protein coupled receptors family 1 profile domain-containing protein n=1 Tax=Elysia chlorotica TaxID=188477 RepID=A0A3S1BIS2_ELYCH|nr:hypothetical protein EGW08_007493 [Elysia chlorotica]